MNTVKVYHTKEKSFDPAEEFAPSLFELVAEVTVQGEDEETDLEDAWGKTNTVRNYWWENPGVLALRKETRSTSIGDVLEYKGKFYAVQRMGFRSIPEVQ